MCLCEGKREREGVCDVRVLAVMGKRWKTVRVQRDSEREEKAGAGNIKTGNRVVMQTFA